MTLSLIQIRKLNQNKLKFKIQRKILYLVNDNATNSFSMNENYTFHSYYPKCYINKSTMILKSITSPIYQLGTQEKKKEIVDYSIKMRNYPRFHLVFVFLNPLKVYSGLCSHLERSIGWNIYCWLFSRRLTPMRNTKRQNATQDH